MAVYVFAELVQLVNFILSPGRSARYVYDSPQGPVTLRFDSYRVDLENRQAEAFGLTVKDPEDGQLAEVDQIQVTLENQVPVVEVSRADLVVQREEDGDFLIQKLLPEAEETREQTPFRVYVDQANVRYIDRTQPETLERVVRLSDVAAEGGKRGFVVNLTAFQSQIGTVPLQIQSLEGGALSLKTNLQRAQLASAWPVLQRWVDLDDLLEPYQPFSFESIIASGPVYVLVPADNQPPEFHGELALEARNVTFGDYLRNAQLQTTIATDGLQFNVDAVLRQAGLEAMFDGYFETKNGLQLAGNVVAEASSLRVLPPGAVGSLPGDLAAEGLATTGYVFAREDSFVYNGEASATVLALTQERLQDVRADLVLTLDSLAVRQANANWRGTPVQAAANLDFNADQIQAYAMLERTRLEAIGAEYGFSDVEGYAEATLAVTGTLASPQAELYATGYGAYRLSPTRSAEIGQFQLRAQGGLDRLDVERLFIQGANGVATGDGFIDLANDRLALNVQGGGIQLAAFDEQYGGLGFFEASIGGSLSNPQAEGRLEVFGASAADQEIPFLAADLRGDLDSLTVDRFVATTGVGVVEGQGEYIFDDQNLSASVTGRDIQLTTFLGEEVVGAVQVPSLNVSGTLEDPQLEGEVIVEGLATAGVFIDQVVVQVEADRRELNLVSAVANIGEGIVTANGKYGLETETGELGYALQNVPLLRAPIPPQIAVVDGSLEGEGDVEVTRGEVQQASFEAFVDDFSVNGEIFGSGPLLASYDGTTVAASGQVGSLDQFIELNGLNYNTETEAISGNVAAFNLDLSKVALALDKQVRQLPQTAADLVLGSEAFASFAAEVEGTLNSPRVTIPGLQVRDLNVLGRDAGVVNAAGTYANERIVLESVEWEDGETRLAAEGSYNISEERADFDASLTNFDLSWVQQFSPEAPDIRGHLNLDLAGAGPLTSLSARGSASVDELARVEPNGDLQPLPVSAAFPFIAFDGQVIESTGRAFVQGFPLDINATLPINSLTASAATEVTSPMVVEMTLPERELSSLREYLPELTGASQGNLSAQARLTGVLGRLELDAGAVITAEQLGLEALDTTFSDVVARFNLDRKAANGFFSLTSNAGGSAQGRFDLEYPDLFEGGLSGDTFLAATDVSAFLSLERLELQEQLPEADAPSRVNLDAEISAAGNLSSPVIDGIASLRQANIVLPSEFPESEEGGPLPINPSFDNLILNVDQGSTIQASTGSISAFGSGRLSGSLNSPNLVLPLTVSEGVFALPTNDVSLERGGTINVLYQGSRLRPSSAQVLLDLQATTTIFASSGAEAYEQYDVTLDITGDLLSDGELNIDAQSDPPDLTEDEILAVLGQRDLIESVASSAFGGGQGGGLTQSLITAATPTLTGGLTDTVASSLTLDYLNVFYNPFDGFIATAGKSLGDGLILRGQRQLTETGAGEDPSWELELNYRLPLRDSFFSRVRVGLGIDYETPWKVSIDWSRRF
jgi:hypothetical protein